MDHLRAYWRMDYIESPQPPSAELFSQLPKNSNDKEVYILWRGPLTYLVMNIFPYNAGHLLAIPYRAIPDLADLTHDEQSELMQTIVLGQKILKKAMKPDGFNIGLNIGKAGGAGIPSHLHAHIVPRWLGDTNFMPVIGKTRVLSKSLDALWEQLYTIAQSI